MPEFEDVKKSLEDAMRIKKENLINTPPPSDKKEQNDEVLESFFRDFSSHIKNRFDTLQRDVSKKQSLFDDQVRMIQELKNRFDSRNKELSDKLSTIEETAPKLLAQLKTVREENSVLKQKQLDDTDRIFSEVDRITSSAQDKSKDKLSKHQTEIDENMEKTFGSAICKMFGIISTAYTKLTSINFKALGEVLKPGEFYEKSTKLMDAAADKMSMFFGNTVGKFFSYFGGEFGSQAYKILSFTVKTGWKIFSWIAKSGMYVIDKAWGIVKWLADIGWESIKGIFSFFSESSKAIFSLMFDMLINVFSNPIVLLVGAIAVVFSWDMIKDSVGGLLSSIIDPLWEFLKSKTEYIANNISKTLGYESFEDLLNNVITVIDRFLKDEMATIWDNTIGSIFGISSDDLIKWGSMLAGEVKDTFFNIIEVITGIQEKDLITYAKNALDIALFVFENMDTIKDSVEELADQAMAAPSAIIKDFGTIGGLLGDEGDMLRDMIGQETAIEQKFREFNKERERDRNAVQITSQIVNQEILSDILVEYGKHINILMQDPTKESSVRSALMAVANKSYRRQMAENLKPNNSFVNAEVFHHINVDIPSLVMKVMGVNISRFKEMQDLNEARTKALRDIASKPTIDNRIQFDADGTPYIWHPPVGGLPGKRENVPGFDARVKEFAKRTTNTNIKFDKFQKELEQGGLKINNIQLENIYRELNETIDRRNRELKDEYYTTGEGAKHRPAIEARLRSLTKERDELTDALKQLKSGNIEQQLRAAKLIIDRDRSKYRGMPSRRESASQFRDANELFIALEQMNPGINIRKLYENFDFVMNDSLINRHIEFLNSKYKGSNNQTIKQAIKNIIKFGIFTGIGSDGIRWQEIPFAYGNLDDLAGGYNSNKSSEDYMLGDIIKSTMAMVPSDQKMFSAGRLNTNVMQKTVKAAELAFGGYVDGPTLAWIGEGDSPEIVIPINDDGIKHIQNIFIDTMFESVESAYDKVNDAEDAVRVITEAGNAFREDPNDDVMMNMGMISSGLLGVS